MLSERDVDEVITVGRTVQYTVKQKVGAEGKLQPKVLLEIGWCKISTRTMRN